MTPPVFASQWIECRNVALGFRARSGFGLERASIFSLSNPETQSTRSYFVYPRFNEGLIKRIEIGVVVIIEVHDPECLVP